MPPAPPPPAPPASQPEWTPPGDTVGGGEGNLHDSPLFAPSGETRRFTITWNPLTLFVVRAEFALEVMIVDHFVLQGTIFYGATRSNEVYPNPGDLSHAHALTTLFQGAGGEVGPRFYTGLAGPRGFFVAPSFLIANYTATPARGAGTPAEVDGTPIKYWNLGGALDIGWQALLSDRWVVGLGGGIQYTVPTHTFPTQELPSAVYANRGLRPRGLITLGVAF